MASGLWPLASGLAREARFVALARRVRRRRLLDWARRGALSTRANCWSSASSSAAARRPTASGDVFGSCTWIACTACRAAAIAAASAARRPPAPGAGSGTTAAASSARPASATGRQRAGSGTSR